MEKKNFKQVRGMVKLPPLPPKSGLISNSTNGSRYNYSRFISHSKLSVIFTNTKFPTGLLLSTTFWYSAVNGLFRMRL